MTIHREGYKLLVITILVLGILNALVFWTITGSGNSVFYFTLAISIVFFLLILQFFRSPLRKVVINDNHIIAPADGKVVVIEEVVETEFFNGPRRQISIFMSPLNVHVNRHPISGQVSYFKYHAGKYLVAWHPKSSTENERTTIVVENTAINQSILIRQIAGALAKRIVTYVDKGSPARQGEELGFIKFGSRVDVFIPLDARVQVSIGQKAVGGKTILAKFA